MRKMGLRLYSSGASPEEIKIVGVLAKANPRAFWTLASGQITSGQDSGRSLREFCRGDARLARMALRICSSSQPSRSRYRENEVIAHALGVCFATPNQRDSWHAQRAASALKGLDSCSASTLYEAIGSAARHGRLAAAEALAAGFPDKAGAPEEARRHTHGVCGYAGSNFGDSASRAWARAGIEAAKAGLPPGRLPSKNPKADEHETSVEAARRMPRNAFFWLCARADSLALDDPGASRAWMSVAATLVARGVPVEDGAESLAIALSRAPTRRALIARRPQLGSPSFHCFHRSATLFGALRDAPASDVAEICAYADTSPDARAALTWTGGGKSVTVHPMPAAAFALLAGHSPDSAWMDASDARSFKVPGPLLDRAARGELAAEDLDAMRSEARGRSHTLASLAAAMSRPVVAEPAPRPPAKQKKGSSAP